jgi:hypothetical protein
MLNLQKELTTKMREGKNTVAITGPLSSGVDAPQFIFTGFEPKWPVCVVKLMYSNDCISGASMSSSETASAGAALLDEGASASTEDKLSRELLERFYLCCACVRAFQLKKYPTTKKIRSFDLPAFALLEQPQKNQNNRNERDRGNPRLRIII